ncbi:MAG: CRISPR-associated endonuclease Cas2 [Salinisphaera sp.]|nr:CRISPR-associated endonuclease Cas2 [Nevskiaceae bacterium]MDN5938418.1 CRISPR-associated endonuclease Cas2 [Salinisphaera sp.]
MPRKLFVVAYDVRKPKRLAAALRVVKGFASGGQKSAYECWLNENEREQLHGELAGVLNLDVDSVAFFPLELRRPVSALGAAVLPADPAYFYVG